jgi:cytosine deaminase
MPALLKNANAAKSAGNTFNAVSIVDRFGNVLMTMVGNEGKSPIRTALMELTRAYASVREQAGADDLRYLPHPKYLKFVSLVGSGKDGVSVMDLGAYGSTVHGEIPKSNSIPFQYIIPKQDPNELDKMVSKFPPLYSDAIKIAPKQVEDIELKRLGEKAAFQMSGV